jgi:hypothetical protein
MKKYLAHFVNQDGSLGGGMNIVAKDDAAARKKATSYAKQIGKKLADLTDANEEE